MYNRTELLDKLWFQPLRLDLFYHLVEYCFYADFNTRATFNREYNREQCVGLNNAHAVVF